MPGLLLGGLACEKSELDDAVRFAEDDEPRPLREDPVGVRVVNERAIATVHGNDEDPGVTPYWGVLERDAYEVRARAHYDLLEAQVFIAVAKHLVQEFVDPGRLLWALSGARIDCGRRKECVARWASPRSAVAAAEKGFARCPNRPSMALTLLSLGLRVQTERQLETSKETGTIMTSFKRILVPTDFGEDSERAIDLAVALAEKFQSHVTLIHSTALPASALSAYAERLYWPTEEMISAAQKELNTTVSKARGRYPNVEGIVVNLEPWRAILDFAQTHHADLIVMGTHGRRGISRVFLGSVAERVVRFSPIPVLTVGGKAEQEAKAKAIAPTASAKQS